MTALTPQLREVIADLLEAPESRLCNCGAEENPPISPVTRQRMAHHCECAAVLVSEMLRDGMTRTLHAQACHPEGGHP